MTNVAIVGAGCAGLGAAATLLENSNANVWLVEALGQVGGRTLTYSNALPVDLGAEAIEDPASNPWVGIAETLHIGTTPAEQISAYRLFQNQAWTTQPNTPGIAVVDAVLNEGYMARRTQPNLPVIGSLRSWDEIPPQMVSLALSSGPYGPIKESAEPWQYLAADMYRQEQLAAAAEEENEENEEDEDDPPPQFVNGGLGSLVARYAASLQQTYGERLVITLNAPVVAVNCQNGNLTLDTGDVLLSSYCIVTAPVSTILQISFTPPFDYDRIAAYRTLRLGSYKKVGFRPTTPPAAQQDRIAANTLYYVYDPELQGTWQYSWLPTDQTVLVCVACGNFAARLDRRLDEVVWARLVQLLNQAHPSGDFTPRNGADQQPLVAVTNWSEKPYIRGAYSYTSYEGGPADDPRPLQARELIAGHHGRAYFAGEATWAMNYGTIAGAYLSGKRAAEQLIEAAGLPAAD